MYLSYGHVINGDFPPLLWEKTGELSDSCLIQALVQALGKSRCSYFADTNLPLASEIKIHYTTLRGHILPLLGVYTLRGHVSLTWGVYIAWTYFSLTWGV